MNIKKLLFAFAFLFLFSQSTLFAQDSGIFAGIEIGGKGIKMSILEVTNIKKGNFTVKSYWSDNVGIARGISIDGNLSEEDMDRAVAVVTSNYKKIQDEFKVPVENIFLVGSSGVAMAKNTSVLTTMLKAAVNKDIEFIDSKTEGRMLLKGCVPPVDYANSMVLDIGGGNTKGGYVDVKNDDNLVFFPLTLSYGTITLTEAVNKKVRKQDLSEFNEKLFGFLPILRDGINAMYGTSPVALEKEKVYMSGGAVWAFYTLYNGGGAKQTFNEFKLEDVLYYDAVLKNNFQSYETLAQTNKDAERVLKTYSQKHLIASSNILMVALEAIPNISEKKLYFAKEGQIVWLISYFVAGSKRVKKKY